MSSLLPAYTYLIAPPSSHTHARTRTRTVFRIGKSIDSLCTALKTIHLTNPVLRFLVTLTQISRGLYLLIDHLIWASRMHLVSIDDRFWGRISNRFWLVAIFLSLLRDLYELLVAIRLEKNRLNQYTPPSGHRASPRTLVSGALRANPALVLDALKNVMDVWIPVSYLDLVALPSGLVGLVGVVSSLAGLVGSHDQRWRLKFS